MSLDFLELQLSPVISPWLYRSKLSTYGAVEIYIMSGGVFHFEQRRLENDLVALVPFDVGSIIS